MLRNISKPVPVVQRLFYWTPLLALFVVLACDSGTDSKSSNTLSTGEVPAKLTFGTQNGSSAANAIAVSASEGNTFYGGNDFDLATLVEKGEGTLSYYIVNDDDTEKAIDATYTLPDSGTVTIRIRAAGNSDYSSKSLYFKITTTAKSPSQLALVAGSHAYDDSDSTKDGSSFANARVLTTTEGNSFLPKTPIDLTSLQTGTAVGDVSYSILTSADATPVTVDGLITPPVTEYTPFAVGTVVIRIADEGSDSIAQGELFVSITFALNPSKLAFTTLNSQLYVYDTTDETKDGSSFANARVLVPPGGRSFATGSTINLSDLTVEGREGLISYSTVASAGATPVTVDGSTNPSFGAYTAAAGTTVVIRIADVGNENTEQGELFVSITFASRMVIQNNHPGYYLDENNGADNRILVYKSDGTNLRRFDIDDVVNFTSLVKDFSVANAANLSYSTDGGMNSSTGNSITLTDVSNDINLDITDPGTGVTLYFTIDVFP